LQITILWDHHNVEHIGRHGVSPTEVEQVVGSYVARWRTDDSVRAGRLVALGPTEGGRLLVVVLDRPSAGGLAYCVTARPMSARERNDYERTDK
jgi:uncharacterized DUF497 family protein